VNFAGGQMKATQNPMNKQNKSAGQQSEGYRQLCKDYDRFLEANPTSEKTLIEFFFERELSKETDKPKGGA
jgi:hypothetical protein